MKYKPQLPDGVKLGGLLTAVFGTMFAGASVATKTEREREEEMKKKQLTDLRNFVERVVDEKLGKEAEQPSSSAQKASASALSGATSSKER